MAGDRRRARATSVAAFAWLVGRPFVRAHAGALLRFAFTSLARIATTTAVVLLIREFLSGVLGEQGGVAARLMPSMGQMQALWTIAAMLLAMFLAGSVFAYDAQVVMQRLIRSLELDLMSRVIRHLLKLPVAFFDRHRRGDLLETVRQDVSNTRTAASAAIETLVHAAQALGYVVAAAVLSPRLLLVAAPILLAGAGPVKWIADRITRRSFGVRRHGYRLTDMLVQLLHGVRIVKIYGGEEAETRSSIERARRYFDELVASVRVRAMGSVLLESLAGLSVVVVIIVGGLEVMRGRSSVPALVAFLIAIRAAHGPLANAFGQYMELHRNWASVERLRNLLQIVPEVRDRPDAVPFEGPVKSLRFENVSFRYGSGSTVLDCLSMDVQAGQRVGIVGPSGAGKTTVISLVARFYDPTGGRVLLNGRDLREYRLADVYRHIAIVTQDPFVFSATVRENIRYGSPGASDDRVEAAARAADVHDDIVALPEGYDTVLGIGGRLLSGGQTQRLNIARALLKNAPLLVLDEATSNLDSISERRVQSALDELMRGRTTIVVAHRLSTLRNVDTILVLDAGRAAGMGPHEALLKESPLYRRLWDAQARPADPSIDTPSSQDPDDLVLGYTER